MESIISIRNKLVHSSYLNLVRPILFAQDPEKMHILFIAIGRILNSNPITKSLVSLAFNYQNPILEQKIAGIRFKNPIGLAAGFDKDAKISSLMADVGFGFTEVGSITAKPCAGNPGIRFKRLIKQKAIWINYGLNNDGADIIHKRLKNKKIPIPVGISVARTNSKDVVAPEQSIADFLYTLRKFQGIGDYIAINTSCPNAFGGCQFSDPKLLNNLLKEVKKLNIKKPIFLKLSPNLTKSNIDKIIDIAKKHKVTGFICTNLTKDPSFHSGGLSGKIVESKSNEQIKYIYKKTKGKFIIIGVGGIFSAQDAYKKIKLGASLIQLITGMIYEGPQLISQINYSLVRLLKRDGYKHISEAIGADNK